MTPTSKLRWVERNQPVLLRGERFDNWQKVLQVWWAMERDGQITPQGEWRDVPLETENELAFSPHPNPLDRGNRVPRFNPDNHEDAPL